jgi:tetratricopeptide (TPR) repeat protein
VRENAFDSLRRIRTVTETLVALLALLGIAFCCGASEPLQSSEARAAFERGEFARAAELFGREAAERPSVAAFHNLGTAQWQLGQVGPAVLSWERALWLYPFAKAPSASLEFARYEAQLEAPAPRWHEAASKWLPRDAWAWLAAGAFWTAASLWLLPGVLGWRQRDWSNAAAAGCLGVFVLTLPAMAGVNSRTQIAVVLDAATPLKLTPTREGQVVTRLPAGEMVRVQRTRDTHLLVRLGGGTTGWVEAARVGKMSNDE